MRRRAAPWVTLLGALLALACGDAPAPPDAPASDSAALHSGLPAEPAGPQLRRALWVLAEGSQRVLEDPARIAALVARAREVGATDLLVQVYRGGRSWFPSSHADDSPWRRAVDRHGVDPLGTLLDRAHAAGLRVHAWFNCLRVADNREAPLLASVGRDAVLVDRKGRSLLDYPRLEVPPPDREHVRMGTRGLWLDPATPGVIEYLERTLDDLVAAAPELDGLHLDIIRHPLALPYAPGSRFDVGLDFGYGAPSKARFEAETGQRFGRGQAWDDFRRARVSETVRRLRERTPSVWAHSAAVLAYADRAYLVAMQDWRRWLEEGWIDFAVPMAYTRDDALLRYQVHELLGGIGGERVWIGLGSWLFAREPARLARQIEIALEADPPGVALFSYDALEDAPAGYAAIPWPPSPPGLPGGGAR